MAGLALAGALDAVGGAAGARAGFATLAGHGGPVMAVDISQDGARALTGSFDNSLGLWDVDSARLIRWLDGHEAAVKTVRFIDTRRAVSGGDDLTARIWDLETGETLHVLRGHTGVVEAVAVSPDRRLLATAGRDRRAGLWDIETGAHLGWLEGHGGPVNDVAFAGGLIYTASSDGTIRSWDPETRHMKRIIVRHGFGVRALLIDPARGWLVYGGQDGGTRVLELATDRLLADLTADRRPVLAIAESPDGSQIAIGDGQGHIMVVATADWSVTNDFRAALRGPIWALAWDGAGERLLAGGLSETAHFWPVGASAAGPLIDVSASGFLRDPASMPNGERQFLRKCSICHSLSDDGVRRAGPSLAGIFGRKAGTWPGYVYSDAVARSGIIWNEETIDALFDLGPEHYIPGTKMPAQRIADPQDRADLIEFLRENS
ncbi:MAG: cytochrome C [Alphaproteobacteria bacterium]|nr:MAG: cytochrome C [Alphaproteobacteria bacterium]